MKKMKRWIALLVALLMCLSLCGCQKLDDMRATHAVYQEDGSILWNGQVYRQLGNVEMRDEIAMVYDHQLINVTTKDVPVLLSDVFGEQYDVCADGTLLESNYWSEGYTLYCREDVYEETAEYLKNGFQLETYYYSYLNEDYDSYNYYLTEYQTNAVNDVLATVIPAPLEEYGDEPIWTSLYLNGCDKTHRFSQDYLMDLWIMEDGSYFLATDEIVYPVPERFVGIFNEITKAYVEAMGDWDGPPTFVVN